jgi:predicted urease superfamily metal-dependent hydrolase
MILHLKDLTESTRKFLDLGSTFSKVTGYKIIIQKSVIFLYTNNKHAEKEIRKIIPFILASKNVIRDKPKQGGEWPVR